MLFISLHQVASFRIIFCQHPASPPYVLHGCATVVLRFLLLVQCTILTYNRQNFEKLLVVDDNFATFVSFITDISWRN